MDAKVAKTQTTAALYFRSMKEIVSGSINNSNPVTLFIVL